MKSLSKIGLAGLVKVEISMTQVNSLSIWVVDPGLMEAGGHHAALAETLFQNQNLITNDVNVMIFSHQLLDPTIKVKLEKVDITVKLHFGTLFYQHYNDGAELGAAGMQSYVRQLCSEYEMVLLSACECIKLNEEPINLFFPCLNWEHAWALNLAIGHNRLLIENSKLKLICCAMYSATGLSNGNYKELWYRLGFKGLVSVANLTLYCSEYELCQVYQSLLDCPDINSHPCYLMDWGSVQDSVDESEMLTLPDNTVLLYLGDAKEDKGFNRLPELLQQSLERTSKDTHFLIQYTLAWDYPELSESIRELKAWAEKEPRLILHQKFLSNQQMTYVMKRIKRAVCTYNTNVYQHKSSGLLWMLAFFNCPFIIDSPCWLTREAERLKLSYLISSGLILDEVSMQQSLAQVSDSPYKQKLFQPLMQWLVNN